MAFSRAAKWGGGGFKRGGFPIWTCPSFFFVLFSSFLSFLGLSRFFWDFPDLLGDGPGIFLISPFPLSRPIKSTYEEQSRKGPRHNLDLSRKSGKHPGLESRRFGFSQLSSCSVSHYLPDQALLGMNLPSRHGPRQKFTEQGEALVLTGGSFFACS